MRRVLLLALAASLPACGGGPSTSPFLGLNLTPLVTEYGSGHPLVEEARPYAAEEDEILRLVNEYRAFKGLPVLQVDESVARVARGHAEHMMLHGFVAHVNPEGDDPLGRWVRVYGMPAALWENAARYYDPQSTFAQWLNSPSHRANMESPSVLTGVGVWGDGQPGAPLYYVHLFYR